MMLAEEDFADQTLAAIIRDTIYVDGGKAWWIPGYADGSLGSLRTDGKLFV